VNSNTENQNLLGDVSGYIRNVK